MAEKPTLFSFVIKKYSDPSNIFNVWKNFSWLRINDHEKKKIMAKGRLLYDSW